MLPFHNLIQRLRIVQVQGQSLTSEGPTSMQATVPYKDPGSCAKLSAWNV